MGNSHIKTTKSTQETDCNDNPIDCVTKQILNLNLKDNDTQVKNSDVQVFNKRESNNKNLFNKTKEHFSFLKTIKFKKSDGSPDAFQASWIDWSVIGSTNEPSSRNTTKDVGELESSKTNTNIKIIKKERNDKEISSVASKELKVQKLEAFKNEGRENTPVVEVTERAPERPSLNKGIHRVNPIQKKDGRNSEELPTTSSGHIRNAKKSILNSNPTGASATSLGKNNFVDPFKENVRNHAIEMNYVYNQEMRNHNQHLVSGDSIDYLTDMLSVAQQDISNLPVENHSLKDSEIVKETKKRIEIEKINMDLQLASREFVEKNTALLTENEKREISKEIEKYIEKIEIEKIKKTLELTSLSFVQKNSLSNESHQNRANSNYALETKTLELFLPTLSQNKNAEDFTQSSNIELANITACESSNSNINSIVNFESNSLSVDNQRFGGFSIETPYRLHKNLNFGDRNVTSPKNASCLYNFNLTELRVCWSPLRNEFLKTIESKDQKLGNSGEKTRARRDLLNSAAFSKEICSQYFNKMYQQIENRELGTEQKNVIHHLKPGGSKYKRTNLHDAVSKDNLEEAFCIIELHKQIHGNINRAINMKDKKLKEKAKTVLERAQEKDQSQVNDLFIEYLKENYAIPAVHL